MAAVSPFTINTATGTITAVAGSTQSSPNPNSFAYDINQQTGEISFIGTYAAGVDATSVAIAGSNP